MDKLSWIYFYHTRRVEHADECDHGEIALQIFKIQGWLRDDLEKMKDENLLSKEALEISHMSDADLKEYGLLESLEMVNVMKDSNINAFHEIGWIDPFPPKIPIPAKKKGKLGKTGTKIAGQKTLNMKLVEAEEKEVFLMKVIHQTMIINSPFLQVQKLS